MISITRIVQTTVAMPAQWDAWDANDVMYYLRYECGHGEVWRLHKPHVYWPDRDLIAEFHKDDDDADCIDLEQFISRAGITLAPDVQSKSFNEHLAEALLETLEAVKLDDEAQP